MVSIGMPYENYKDYEQDTYHLKGVESNDILLMGSLYKELELSKMDDKVFRRLALGESMDGTPLVQTAVKNTHEKNGREIFNAAHRPGTDFTFSPHKSVSLAALLSPDPAVRQAVREAHDKAVASVAKYIEKNLIQVRDVRTYIDVNGNPQKVTKRINTGNMIAAAITHYISRDNDPQLHTHLVIFNLTKVPETTKFGFNFKAIANEKLFKNRTLLNNLYDNELSHQLQKHGFETGRIKNRYASLKVDEKAIEYYSKRRHAIEIKAEQIKKDYPNASYGQRLMKAALMTRREKGEDGLDLPGMITKWQADIEKNGFIIDPARQAEPAKLQYTPRQYIKYAIKNIFEHESTFTQQDVLNQASRLSAGQASLSSLISAWEKMVEKNTQVREEKLTKDNILLGELLGEKVYTTKEVFQEEKKIIRIAKELHKSAMPVVSKLYIDQELERKAELAKLSNQSGLTKGQKNAVRKILDGSRITLVQGDAGTGKTTMVKTVADILSKHSRKGIIGLSYTGKAAYELYRNGGIDSMTIDSFHRKPDIKLDNKIVIVDESSMLSSKAFLKVLDRITPTTKIVLIGDYKQLQSIGPGNTFDNLRKTVGSAIMNEIIRQKPNPSYLEVAARMSRLDSEKAFAKMKDMGALVETTNDNYIGKIVKDYMADRNAVIVTPANTDKQDINIAIREKLAAKGILRNEHEYELLHQKLITKTEQLMYGYYQEGDVIRFNTSIPGQKAGDVETIKDAQIDKLVTVDKHGHEHSRRYTDIANNVNVFERQIIKLATGDSVISTMNSHKMGVKNGEQWTVKKIEGDVITLKHEDKIVKVNAKEYQFLDYGYCVTNYKSQGLTADRVVAYFDSAKDQLNSFNSIYVAITRGRQDLKVYSNDFGTLLEQAKDVRLKESVRDVDKKIWEEKNKWDLAGEQGKSNDKGNDQGMEKEISRKRLG
ncbi:MAG: relaxase domain-containing protein [Brevinematales bacterium]|nr:relaxase domain-containing protein [Brevinematales bacterium]